MPYKRYRNKQKRRNYLTEYMREYRKAQRQLLEQARRQLGLSTKIRTRKKEIRKRRKK